MDDGARKPTLHLGIDLGGTNIKWAVLAGDDWQTVDNGQAPTGAADGPPVIVQRLAAIARRQMTLMPAIESIGIGVAGPFDPALGTVRDLTNFAGDWDGVPIGPRLGEAVDRPTHLINDARAFGLAELRLGAGRGASSMVGMTLGTGLGGVIAIDGKVVQGHDGSAGELGHQTMDPDGPVCNCGNRGCLEMYVRADVLAAAAGTPTVEEAIARTRAGDPTASAALSEAGRYLGIGLANVITFVTPDVVVIGGGNGTAAFDLLIGAIRAELDRRVKMTRLDLVEIVPAQLGTWAGAIGAAIHGAVQAPSEGA